MTHTPGPWAWDGPPDNIHVVQAAHPHMRVCFLTSDGPTEANARLIAAAPDMHAEIAELERKNAKLMEALSYCWEMCSCPAVVRRTVRRALNGEPF